MNMALLHIMTVFLIVVIVGPASFLAQSSNATDNSPEPTEQIPAAEKFQKDLAGRAHQVTGRLKGTLVKVQQYPQPPNTNDPYETIEIHNGSELVQFYQVVTTDSVELYLSPTKSPSLSIAPQNSDFVMFFSMDFERNFIESGLSPLRTTSAADANPAHVAHSRRFIDSDFGLGLVPHFLNLKRIASAYEQVEIRQDGSAIEALFTVPRTLGPYFSKVRWQS
jgi:hypothetical protein